MEPLTQLGAISGALKTNLLLSIVVVLLLMCSAFFSASETSFSTASAIRLRSYAEEKRRGARKALYVAENYERALITILVGNNLVNIACTTICAFIFSNTIANPTLANLLNTIIMTIVVLICGEITPKCTVKINPDKWALRFSGVLYFLMKIMIPLTYPFYLLQKAMLKRVANNDTPTVTENELESIIDKMEEEGVLDSDDADLMQGVLDLGSKTAYDVMTPRVDVTAIDITSKIDEIKNLFIETQYSRIPVYSKNVDHIVGILSQKDFFTALLSEGKVSVKNLMVEPLFINENMKVDAIIRQMQKVKKHMAVVIDEYGGTSGIVTMEDAVEEVVGEIYDEHDDFEKNPDDIQKVDENKYIVDGDIEIEKLFEYLEIEHLPDTQYVTLNGFLFELAQNLPKTDQQLEWITIDERLDKDANFVEKTIKMYFKLTKVVEKRIREVMITIDDTL